MIVIYQLEHRIKGEWKAAPYKITVEAPTMTPPVLNWPSLDEAFTGALEIAGCRDRAVNFEQIRVTVTRSEKGD